MHHLAAALEAAESGGLAPLSASLLGEHEWVDASILGTRGVCLRRLAQLEEECSEQVVARGGGADEAWSRSYKAFRLYQQAVSCCDETAPSSEADASVANSFDGWLGGTTPRLWGGEEEGGVSSERGQVLRELHLRIFQLRLRPAACIETGPSDVLEHLQVILSGHPPRLHDGTPWVCSLLRCICM
jgi:hypothetical protein